LHIQLLSDLHVEFHRDGGRAFVDSLDPSGIDVLLVAGDLAVAEGITAALGLVCRRFRHATVVYVHGNHEFYGSVRDTVLASTRQALAENPNLAWLDASHVEVDGIRFLGTPLWFPPHPSIPAIKHMMTDFSLIANFESWVYEENARAITFLEENLRAGDVVLTHHLPSQRCMSPRFVGHPLNPFFVCDLTNLILERSPRLWLHGHSHESTRVSVGKTQVLCNPFGYARVEQNPAFEDKLVFNI
jgi:Icc-related predicted phosphoesterase